MLSSANVVVSIAAVPAVDLTRVSPLQKTTGYWLVPIPLQSVEQAKAIASGNAMAIAQTMMPAAERVKCAKISECGYSSTSLPFLYTRKAGRSPMRKV